MKDIRVFLKGGAACRYKIVFPKEAMEDDKITINMDKLERVNTFAVDTPKWSSEKFNEHQPQQGETLEIKYPNSLFITFLSQLDKRVSGDFEVSYKFIPSGKVIEGPFVGSLNFYILISVAGFIVVAIMSALCIYLCCQCRTNSKLEK